MLPNFMCGGFDPFDYESMSSGICPACKKDRDDSGQRLCTFKSVRKNPNLITNCINCDCYGIHNIACNIVQDITKDGVKFYWAQSFRKNHCYTVSLNANKTPAINISKGSIVKPIAPPMLGAVVKNGSSFSIEEMNRRIFECDSDQDWYDSIDRFFLMA